MMRLALISLLLVGCGTTLTTARYTLHTYGDATALNISADGALSARALIHSRPTTAALSGTSRLVGAASAAALLSTGGPPVVKAAGLLPAIIPAFRTGASNQP